LFPYDAAEHRKKLRKSPLGFAQGRANSLGGRESPLKNQSSRERYKQKNLQEMQAIEFNPSP
jgi:hypothetical protein